MNYKIVNCDSVVKKIIKNDSLFHGNYCVDPYQNCEFGCQYCDSSLDKTIYIKANVNNILKKEIKHIRKGRIIIGSVNDPYQNLEKKYKLTRTILETLTQFNFPCHILTKSPLILRDIDLLSKIQCIVTVSISSLNNKITQIFEPDVPTPKIRLQIVKTLRNKGITTGIALIPMLPYIVEAELESIVKVAHSVGSQYLIHKHLELKGDQKQVVRNLIEIHYPHLLQKYDAIYEDDFTPQTVYIQELNNMLSGYCRKFKISEKIKT